MKAGTRIKIKGLNPNDAYLNAVGSDLNVIGRTATVLDSSYAGCLTVRLDDKVNGNYSACLLSDGIDVEVLTGEEG